MAKPWYRRTHLDDLRFKPELKIFFTLKLSPSPSLPRVSVSHKVLNRGEHELTSSSPPKLNLALGFTRSLCCFLIFAARVLGDASASVFVLGASSDGEGSRALAVLCFDLFMKAGAPPSAIDGFLSLVLKRWGFVVC